MRALRYLLAVAAIAVAPTGFASDEASGITISPGIGMSIFDGGRRIDDAKNASLGLGYRFDSPWAVELKYTNGNAETSGANLDVDISQWHLDGLYHMESPWAVKSFLSFGLGQSEQKIANLTNKDDQMNIGMGFKYLFSPKSALRADMKIYRSFDNKELDSSYTLSYQYTFGETSKRAAPRPVAAPVAVDGDSDRDGIRDSLDRCPGTAAGVSVDGFGCPDDDDRDGVKNAVDQCPATPANTRVNAQGCAPDSDRDGVADAMDMCADTFPPALVDAKGCYRILTETVRITLDVEFDFDSAKARPEHKTEVKKVADFMAQYPKTDVILEGHSDSLGNDNYNQRLSEKRASTIAEMLVDSFSIDRKRVSFMGYGEAKPIASNSDEAGRQRNRRVVAEIKATTETKVTK
jgi:OOP family OmpA-OmpF porin